MDKETIALAARQGRPFDLTTFTLTRETEIELEEILGIFLDELGQRELFDFLSYSLKELTTNAKKANTKRVYFNEKKLDLQSVSDYEKGMKGFKDETLGKISHYLDLQEAQGLYVSVRFQIADDELRVVIRNNTPILPRELARVYDKIARSRLFSSVEDAFMEEVDSSEGAGLGIILMMLMLRKMGLSEKAYSLSAEDEETVARLTVPRGKLKMESMTQLANEIIQVIDSLPPFPENISRVQKMMTDEEVDLERVAGQLSLDPALTAELVKFVNSAELGSRRHVESIGEAVRLVGIHGLQSMLYTFGAHKLLSRFLVKQKSLWEDAVRVSSYSRELARNFRFSHEQQGEVQIGGLLFNLGGVVLSYVHPNLHERVLDFCVSRSLTPELLESLSESLQQGEIGARIAGKWNFPAPLIAMIQYNDRPQRSPKDSQGIVSVIALAASLVLMERNLLTYRQLNAPVLKAFQIADEAQLLGLHETLKTNFSHGKN